MDIIIDKIPITEIVLSFFLNERKEYYLVFMTENMKLVLICTSDMRASIIVFVLEHSSEYVTHVWSVTKKKISLDNCKKKVIMII